MKKWLGAPRCLGTPILEGVSGAEIKVRGAWRNRKRGAEGWKELKASRYSVSVLFCIKSYANIVFGIFDNMQISMIYIDFSSISYKDNVCLIIAALYSCYME